jgi:hypothetical protein
MLSHKTRTDAKYMTDLAALLGKFEGLDNRPLPVECWHPEHCGEINILIDAKGDWYHKGILIGRERLVRLLSRVLRKDEEGYVLVTPQEKLKIQVEDVPFLTVLVNQGFDHQQRPRIEGITNVGDQVLVSSSHPLELRPFGPENQLLPYIHIRGDLWARCNRNSYYQLVQWAQPMDEAGTSRLGVESDGVWFCIG